MSLPTDEQHPPHALLAISVWFEADHEQGFRARVRSLDAAGHMAVVGITSNRQEVTEMVGEWLESLDAD